MSISVDPALLAVSGASAAPCGCDASAAGRAHLVVRALAGRSDRARRGSPVLPAAGFVPADLSSPRCSTSASARSTAGRPVTGSAGTRAGRGARRLAPAHPAGVGAAGPRAAGPARRPGRRVDWRAVAAGRLEHGSPRSPTWGEPVARRGRRRAGLAGGRYVPAQAFPARHRGRTGGAAGSAGLRAALLGTVSAQTGRRTIYLRPGSDALAAPGPPSRKASWSRPRPSRTPCGARRRTRSSCSGCRRGSSSDRPGTLGSRRWPGRHRRRRAAESGMVGRADTTGPAARHAAYERQRRASAERDPDRPPRRGERRAAVVRVRLRHGAPVARRAGKPLGALPLLRCPERFDPRRRRPAGARAGALRSRPRTGCWPTSRTSPVRRPDGTRSSG